VRRGIRTRLTLNAVVVMTIAIAIASFALVTLLRQSLLRNVDARTKLRLQDIAALVESGTRPTTLAGEDEDSTVAQLVSADQILAQSPVVEPSKRLADFVPNGNEIVIRTVHNAPIADGAAEYRVAAEKVDTQFGPIVVYAAASVEPVSDSIHTLVLLLVVVGPLLVLLVGAMTWWFVGRTLSPVEEIRRQVADISATDLDKRVPEPETADEVQRLAATMNAMLGRVEDAVRHQRTFVSDAAHELRSPLAAIRAELDVASAHRDLDDWPTVVERLGRCTRRMERLVEDLLLIAITDEQGPRRRAEVDLDELLMRQLEHLHATSPLAIDVGRLDAARVWGDGDQLERLITNLFDNAERHAAATITVELTTNDHTAQLTIADDGPGVPSEHRRNIFDRFSRVDDARDRASGGTGLGLAIVHKVLEDHGGSIDLDDAAPGTHFVVRLPLAIGAQR
jgi:signal transduction histidine kinase